MVCVENQFNVRVHVLLTDGGGEYHNLDLFCQQTGVGRQTTERDSPASNGIAERMHRTIMNMVRCMLFGCGLPIGYWGYSAEYAAFVLKPDAISRQPEPQIAFGSFDGEAGKHCGRCGVWVALQSLSVLHKRIHGQARSTGYHCWKE